MKEVYLHPQQVSLQTAKPVALLLAGWLGLDDFPSQAASLHLGARQDQGQEQISSTLRLSPACGS